MEFHQVIFSTLREKELNTETFTADIPGLTELAMMAEGQEDDNRDK